MRNVGSHSTGPNPSVRFLSLLRLALPSILLQSGAPLAITFQTALIGRKATELVAAWAIVASECWLCCRRAKEGVLLSC